MRGNGGRKDLVAVGDKPVKETFDDLTEVLFGPIKNSISTYTV